MVRAKVVRAAPAIRNRACRCASLGGVESHSVAFTSRLVGDVSQSDSRCIDSDGDRGSHGTVGCRVGDREVVVAAINYTCPDDDRVLLIRGEIVWTCPTE